MSFRAVQRRLADALEQGTRAESAGGPTLEAQRTTTGEPPRIAGAAVIEGDTIKRRPVPGDPEVGFTAFLDGIQASRVLLYDSSVPIVYGSVGAVIRIREDRRLSTWERGNESRVYAPRGFLSRPANESLDGLGGEVIDTTPRRADGEADVDVRHPLMLSDVAVHAVQGHRENLEQKLAESWCSRSGNAVLYVDGGISGSAKLSGSTSAAGVVKSHRVLYGDREAVCTILALGERERSSVFAITSPNRWRSTVASWYVRLRDPLGRDPLWGLVRAEVAAPLVGGSQAITAYADQVSRWILAEVAPLSLPDSRWDTMVYGIRDCEQFLRAIG